MDIYGEQGDNNQRQFLQNTVGNVDQNFLKLFYDLEYAINLKNGVIYINSDIDDFVLYDVISKINLIQQYRKDENIPESEPITLLINSSGGDVYTALGIIDYIQGISTKINTVCRGRAMSAAALILAAGTGTRAASKHSTIMIHEIASDFFGKASELKTNVQHLGILEDSLLSILEVNTKKDKQWWKDNFTRDLYLTPTQAIDLGIIDQII